MSDCECSRCALELFNRVSLRTRARGGKERTDGCRSEGDTGRAAAKKQGRAGEREPPGATRRLWLRVSAPQS